VTARGALERIDQLIERIIQTEHGVVAVAFGIVEEAVMQLLLATRFADFHPVRGDHIVQPLEGVARHLGPLADNVQILGECSFPGFAAELFQVLSGADQRNDVGASGHGFSLWSLLLGSWATLEGRRNPSLTRGCERSQSLAIRSDRLRALLTV